MTDAQAQTTLGAIRLVMFTVSDQDAAVEFYTQKLGFEVRDDAPYGDGGGMRWLTVAPPGSATELSLNPPMGGRPGGGTVGVESSDVEAEHARLRTAGGVDVDPEVLRTPGAPLLFMLRDPDGNTITVVERPR